MNIKQILKEKKMTQVQLAKALGVTERTIRRWIDGSVKLSNRNVIAIEHVTKNV